MQWQSSALHTTWVLRYVKISPTLSSQMCGPLVVSCTNFALWSMLSQLTTFLASFIRLYRINTSQSLRATVLIFKIWLMLCLIKMHKSVPQLLKFFKCLLYVRRWSISWIAVASRIVEADQMESILRIIQLLNHSPLKSQSNINSSSSNLYQWVVREMKTMSWSIWLRRSEWLRKKRWRPSGRYKRQRTTLCKPAKTMQRRLKWSISSFMQVRRREKDRWCLSNSVQTAQWSKQWFKPKWTLKPSISSHNTINSNNSSPTTLSPHTILIRWQALRTPSQRTIAPTIPSSSRILWAPSSQDSTSITLPLCSRQPNSTIPT